MKIAFFFLFAVVFAAGANAATDVRFNFTLNTTDPNGAPLTQSRYYHIYRPDGLSRAIPSPMVLVMEAVPGSSPAGFFHRKADQAGFIVVSCSIVGNTLGTVWNNDDPRITGFEDIDYTTEVINQVKASNNCNDAFICGLSKGGHMAYAYACEMPGMLKAACSIDEFMGLTSNIPKAPLPIIALHGTMDKNVPYTMAKDSVDVWRTIDGLLRVTPVTTYESSSRMPGKVIQATWRNDINDMQVAFVTIIGGAHEYPLTGISTGYDCTDGIWTFFSQFLTGTQASPKIFSQPVNNMQIAGHPASFRVSATGNQPLTYKWQKNGVDIPGATANWYTTPITTMADNRSTFCAVVSNSQGSITSTAAILTVKDSPKDPTITTQPVNQTVTAGQPVAFTVDVNGTWPVSYQWQKNGIDLIGETSSSLIIPSAIGPDSGAAFSVMVSSRSGSVTSTHATLTVKPALGAPIILRNPVRARVIVNQTAIFSVAAWSPTPMSYQWQKGHFLDNMVNIVGATAATYTTPANTLEDHLTLLRCVVSNAAGSTTSASEMLMVTTNNKAPTDITSVINVSTQVGIPFTYTITSSGGTTPITYSAIPLPAGLSVDAATGRISGTPTVTGTTRIIITANNSSGGTSATLVLNVTSTSQVVSTEAWRSSYFGASAINSDIAGNSADPDGDGVNNLFEYINGTDPLAANAVK